MWWRKYELFRRSLIVNMLFGRCYIKRHIIAILWQSHFLISSPHWKNAMPYLFLKFNYDDNKKMWILFEIVLVSLPWLPQSWGLQVSSTTKEKYILDRNICCLPLARTFLWPAKRWSREWASLKIQKYANFRISLNLYWLLCGLRIGLYKYEIVARVLVPD